ncbi:M18 family aminopeptidase [Candidatus Parabeggiatoa sp. HSG14]|uniref:M18 family aminopeptidase n=1 Tax=Candidatus Parabeggiatoa sp. HSG14 TaxID=3055593 RepID=UPI0025A7985B|nr:M18 family aminopeptidase [Thiotrichales bacterium HSG14]
MNKQAAHQLLDFIDNSPSPWHVAISAAMALEKKDFQRLDERDAWKLEEGGRYYVIRDGSSIIGFIVGNDDPIKYGFRIIGAHTDSPGLRVKPNAPYTKGPMVRLGVEIYGGPILATFTDRDLSLAGRVVIKTGDVPTDIDSRLIHFEKPIVRIPNLAIHLNQGVNQQGLKLDHQEELPLVLSVLQENLPAQQQFRMLLADKIGVEADVILSWELQVFDTQPGSFFGPDEQFIANGQLDNLASCHAGLCALLDDQVLNPKTTNLIAYFDHEEVGSQSNKGAGGSFLTDVLERISLAMNLDRESQKRANANSFLLSADTAHAYHPNYKKFYDDEHKAIVNSGPTIKINAKQRYTSESISEALFMRLCEQAEVPYQKAVHRTNLACGSTIGPQISAQLGIRSVDVGNPIWAMHSARESGGTLDHHYMIKAMTVFFAN